MSRTATICYSNNLKSLTEFSNGFEILDSLKISKYNLPSLTETLIDDYAAGVAAKQKPAVAGETPTFGQ